MANIQVLMAVYKPNEIFFEKQLRSINNQSMKNISVSILDDSADINVFNRISKIVENTLVDVSYNIERNTMNMGSNKTFEKMTIDSISDYIVYADQDDIWESNKIEKLFSAITLNDSLLAFSDLSVIDSSDNEIYNSITKFNKLISYKGIESEHAFANLLNRNCITGCTIMIQTSFAKEICPFPNGLVHDHWLGLMASNSGKISFVNESLVKYRIHQSNQIGAGILKKQKSKKDYIKKYQDEVSFLIDLQSLSIINDKNLKVINKSIISKRRLQQLLIKPSFNNLFYVLFLSNELLSKRIFGMVLSVVSEKSSLKLLKLLKST